MVVLAAVTDHKHEGARLGPGVFRLWDRRLRQIGGQRGRRSSHNQPQPRVLLLLTDLFLVGATLMIAAFGLYELFITRIDPSRPGMRLPGWLRMNDLNDLKARVISMIILVAAVTFVDVVVETEPDGGLNTFYLGSGIAVVIAALTAFMRFGRVDSSD
jgi:hypothetical protein